MPLRRRCCCRRRRSSSCLLLLLPLLLSTTTTTRTRTTTRTTACWGYSIVVFGGGIGGARRRWGNKGDGGSSPTKMTMRMGDFGGGGGAESSSFGGPPPSSSSSSSSFGGGGRDDYAGGMTGRGGGGGGLFDGILSGLGLGGGGKNEDDDDDDDDDDDGGGRRRRRRRDDDRRPTSTGGGGGTDFVSGLRRGMMMDVVDPEMILPGNGRRRSSYDDDDPYYPHDDYDDGFRRGGGGYRREQSDDDDGDDDDDDDRRGRENRIGRRSSNDANGYYASFDNYDRGGGGYGNNNRRDGSTTGYGRRWNDMDPIMTTGGRIRRSTRRRNVGPPRPMITTEARTSTATTSERSLLSEMLPGTRRFSARDVGYNEPMVGSDASLSPSAKVKGRAAAYYDGDLSQQQQRPSLLSEILPENQRLSARAVRYNEMSAVAGSDVSLSPSAKNKGRAAAYYGGDPAQQQQASLLSEILPETLRSSARDVGYNGPPVVGSDASLSPPKSTKRGYDDQDLSYYDPSRPIGSAQQTSTLSFMLPDTQRSSAVAIKYNNAPAIIGSDASLSPPKTIGYNNGQDTYGQDYQQPFSSTQQTSTLSHMLPDTQRSSAVAIKYNNAPTIIGSDASLSPSKAIGYNNGQDTYGQDYQQPFSSTQQTSTLSHMLPDNQRVSAQAIRYNDPPVVGSDASLSPSSSASRGYYGPGAGRNFDTLGPSGASFVANDYDNWNSLSALASSFQVSRPSSRNNNNNDGSAIGSFSPRIGLGGSDATGVGMGIGRAFDYDTGDWSPTSDYHSKPTKIESIRDAGVKDHPSSVLGSIASASRRRMKEIERYVYREDNASVFMPQQGSIEGDYNGYNMQNYGDNADQYSYDANGDYYDSYQSGDQTSFAP